MEESVPISPEKVPIGPEKAPIRPEKARFSRKDFCPIISEKLGLKPPFVSPRLDFPKFTSIFQVFQTLFFKASKAPCLTLKLATPSGAPRDAEGQTALVNGFLELALPGPVEEARQPW